MVQVGVGQAGGGRWSGGGRMNRSAGRWWRSVDIASGGAAAAATSSPLPPRNTTLHDASSFLALSTTALSLWDLAYCKTTLEMPDCTMVCLLTGIDASSSNFCNAVADFRSVASMPGPICNGFKAFPHNCKGARYALHTRSGIGFRAGAPSASPSGSKQGSCRAAVVSSSGLLSGATSSLSLLRLSVEELEDRDESEPDDEERERVTGAPAGWSTAAAAAGASWSDLGFRLPAPAQAQI